MKIIHQILSSSFFSSRPPVLIDIGASEEVHAKWKAIAPYSICLAFDADEREFNVSEKTKSGYKKLITVNRIVTAEPIANPSFYLTQSPFCSSLLKPDTDKLAPWLFADLFKIDREINLPAVTINSMLRQAGLSYIDWFKTDSQGTDLRIFKSIGEEVLATVLAAEFEPGIMDAYEGEDKLFQVMEEMDKRSFWVSTMDLRGTQRLSPHYVKEIGESYVKRIIRRSPCWAEVVYLHQPIVQEPRDLLMLFVFSIIEKQYGFALELADKGIETFGLPIFNECRSTILARIRREKFKAPVVIFKRQFNKFFSTIND